MPGVTLETVSAAYDGHRIVRGSNIRGGKTQVPSARIAAGRVAAAS